MACDEAQQEVLLSTETTPIAQLQPETAGPNSLVVCGVVTITWPYSVVTKSIAFILAEHDPRLRRDNGQVRIEFHDATARALAEFGVGGGDEVRLSLEGVEWVEDKTPSRRPGMLDWQMKFTNRLLLQVRRAETNQTAVIDIANPAEEVEGVRESEQEMRLTPPIDIMDHTYTMPLPRTPHASIPTKRLASVALEPGEYASPAFLKRARVSYGSLFEDGFDIFNDDEPRKDKKQRKSRFSLGATSWKYSSRSPSPEAEQTPEPQSELPTNAAEQPHIPEIVQQPVSTSPRPTMVDQGCQTKELDVSPPGGVQVIAESRLNGTLLESTPTPGWKQVDFSGAFQESPPLSFHPITARIDSPTRIVETLHSHTPPSAPDFDMPINIDPSLQFHTADAITQPPQYPMTPVDIQSREGEFPPPHTQNDVEWTPATSTSPYPTLPTQHLAAFNEVVADPLSSTTEIITERYTEERNDTHNPDHNLDDTHTHENMDEDTEEESVEETESEEDRHQPETLSRPQKAEETTSGVRWSSSQDDESVDESEETEEEYDDEEENHWEPRVRPQNISREEDEGDDGYDEYTENEYDDDEAGEDEQDEDTEEEQSESEEDEERVPAYNRFMPVPRAATRPAPPPGPPKEPVFISLLSDSEDDDNSPPAPIKSAEIKEENPDPADDQKVEDDEATEEEEEISDIENEDGPKNALQSRVSINSHLVEARSINQLDGCDDVVENEHAMNEDIKSPMDGTAEIDSMELVPSGEVHQNAVPTKELADEMIHTIAEPTTPGAHDEQDSMVQQDSTTTDVVQSDGKMDATEPVRGPAHSPALEATESEVPDIDNRASDVQATQNTGTSENMEATELANETLASAILPSDDVGAGNAALRHDDEDRTIPERHTPELDISDLQDSTKGITEKVDENGTVIEDVEMGDADAEPLIEEEQEIPHKEDARAAQVIEEPVSTGSGPVNWAAPSSPPATQTEYTQPVSVVEAVPALARQESARQLPTPRETQIEDDMAYYVQPDLEFDQTENVDDADDVAASQQLMSEFVQYSSPHKENESRPTSAVSVSPTQPRPAEHEVEPTPRREAKEPELLITVQSLRSHCRSQRQSIDSPDELTMDPCSSSGRGSPTMAQFCLVPDPDAPPILRASRPKNDSSDPSIALAKAAEGVHPQEEKKASVNLRVRRGKNNSFDPSLLLAQSFSPPSERSPRKAVSPPMILRAGRRRGRSDPSLQLAAVSPKAGAAPHDAYFTTYQPGRSSPLRSSTPESVMTKGTVPRSPIKSPLKSPSVASSVAEDGTVSTLKLQLLKSLRTSLPDHLPLRNLRTSLNKTVDILAVATTTPEPPHRPKHGPRDYMLKLTLTDPSIAPNNVSIAHIFRPHQTSLPVVHTGDVVLLRRVQVVSIQGRGFGVRAGDVSAWAVFEKGDEEMLPQIKGPPVEVVAEEVEHAQGLRRWWSLQGDRALARIEKATQRTSQDV